MVSDSEIKEIIEQLSEALVLLDITDLQALGNIHTYFGQIHEWADSGSIPEVAQAAKAATAMVGDVMLEETSDLKGTMELVNKITSALQEIIIGGKSPENVSFPSEAGIGKSKTGKKSGKTQKKSSSHVKVQDLSSADPGLLTSFIQEAIEHLDSADVLLLNLERSPDDDESLNAVFRAFHTIKGVAGFLGLEEIQSLSHEGESLLEKARKKELELSGDAIDLAFEIKDTLKRLVEKLTRCFASREPMPFESDLDALIDQIRLVTEKSSAAELRNASEESPAGGAAESRVSDSPVTAESEAEAIDEPVAGKILVSEQPGRQLQSMFVKEMIKVDAEKLDRLVDMIGEMVITETMVSQAPELQHVASTQFFRHLRQLDKITKELHETGMSLRMVPLRATFQKMARLARDVAKKSGKSIEFVMAGEDTELDKTVVDKIGDPLVHMIRNAVDHGIESIPDERLKAGKPAAGRVELRAFHKGGNIYIEVQDDGQGLSKERILEKAREKGLISDGVTLTDHEIFSLIFEPGFSTAKTITDVSGRGVGMDVVKKNIEDLNGQIDIVSEEGKGSVFTIRLPLTLAIIDGMVVRVGAERYIIPTLSIIGSLRPMEKDISTVMHKGEMLSFQGHLIPLLHLDAFFDIGDAQQDPSEAIVIIVEDGTKKIGVVADEILGQQQIVIKSLGEVMQQAAGLSGCAIMPDGQVGLILDISSIVKLAGFEKLAA